MKTVILSSKIEADGLYQPLNRAVINLCPSCSKTKYSSQHVCSGNAAVRYMAKKIQGYRILLFSTGYVIENSVAHVDDYILLFQP